MGIESTKGGKELDIVYLYAEAWNKLDFSLIQPHLADDVCYASQNVFDELEGKEEVAHYLEGKMETIRKHPLAKVFAEIGFCGNQHGQKVQVLSAYENRPCVVLAQGQKDDVVGLVLIDVEEEKIKRIGICSVVPHPSTASRTGIYPGKESAV